MEYRDEISPRRSPARWETAVSGAKEESPGPPLFEDVTAASGLRFVHRNGEDTANHLSILESLGGGVALLDYDGDGLLDVFLPGGGFFAGAGLDKGITWATSAAFGDLDGDGYPDLYVCQYVNDPVTILRGIGGEGRHWLGVQLLGKGHADVVGARVELRVGERTWTRFAKGGGSYLSSGDRRQLFGLGEETKPGRLTVTWPNGARQHFDGLASDRYYRILQWQGKAEPFSARE
jgi:hypothetical protein